MQISLSEEPEFWGIRRAARYLDVSEGFLRKRVRLQQVPFTRIGSKILRFRRSDLDRWLQEGQNKGR